MRRGLRTYHRDPILEAFFGCSGGTDPIDSSQIPRRTQTTTVMLFGTDPSEVDANDPAQVARFLGEEEEILG